MDPILQERFLQSLASNREQLQYIQTKLQEWADQRGGIVSLSDHDRNIYNLRYAGYIKLAMYHDASLEYIHMLEQWIESLIIEARQLRATDRTRRQPWSQLTESGRNYHDNQRDSSIMRAQMTWPELY